MALAFVPNAGQADARVRFQAHAGGTSFYFTPTEAVFALAGQHAGHVLRLGFVGANSRVEIEGARRGAAKVNYFRGSNPARWHADLPTYEEVIYRELWPGIDLAFTGEAGTLKYEFRVAPGANPSAIRLAYQGAERLSVGKGGDLHIETALGVVADAAPVSYQLVRGERVPVESRYAVSGTRYDFALGRYDRRSPLVIDPGLAYSTYLGASDNESGFGIAIDAAGNAYVTGFTSSGEFPTTAGAFDTSLEGNPGGQDAFVTKLGPGGTALVYSTFLGGSGTDLGSGIAVDAVGNAYVTGSTSSPDFPTTVSAFDRSFGGGRDAFVAKLGPAGTALVYSTYLGGSGGTFGDFQESGQGIAVDGAGNAYVVGYTDSPDFPTTPGAFDTSLGAVIGFTDAFVTKLGPSGGAPLLYSTYLGGNSFEYGRGIAVDAAGNAYVTGFTQSTNFPTTPGAFDTTGNVSEFLVVADAFVTKLGPTGSAPLLYSTFLGGSGGFDDGYAIAVDGAGNVYVTGYTQSADFPTTEGAFDTTLDGFQDAFVTRLVPTGGVPLVYSTYLGGSDGEGGAGIAVDGAGNAYVTGFTRSADFPTTADAFDTSVDDGDAFVTKLDSGGALPYSTYLGGSASDSGGAIAVDRAGNAYLTGSTYSGDFPITEGAFDQTVNPGVGTSDAFVTKLSTTLAPVPARLDLSPAEDTNPVGTSHTVTASVSDSGGNPVGGVTVRFTVSGSVSTSGSCRADASGQCDFSYQGPDFPGADVIAAFADTHENGVPDADEPAAIATKVWMLPASTPGDILGAGVLRGAPGEKITFGFLARNTWNGPRGACHFDRHLKGRDDKVTCLNVTALVVIGNTATFYGDARHNGHPTTYRITARENDRPMPDEVTVTTTSGFGAGGPLEHGTVKVKD